MATCMSTLSSGLPAIMISASAVIGSTRVTSQRFLCSVSMGRASSPLVAYRESQHQSSNGLHHTLTAQSPKSLGVQITQQRHAERVQLASDQLHQQVTF